MQGTKYRKLYILYRRIITGIIEIQRVTYKEVISAGFKGFQKKPTILSVHDTRVGNPWRWQPLMINNSPCQ